MKVMKSEELTVSEDEARAFLSSKMWADMEAEVERWREALRDQLEQKSDERNGGRAEACAYFLSLPAVILDDVVQSKIEEAKGEKDGSDDFESE